MLNSARRSAATSTVSLGRPPLRSPSAPCFISQPQRSIGSPKSVALRRRQRSRLRSNAALGAALQSFLASARRLHCHFAHAQFVVPLCPPRGALGDICSRRSNFCPQWEATGSHLSAAAFPASTLPPNPSLERTATGRAGWPRSGQSYHPLRGQPALPVSAAQLKR
jgi:hypothetical protein